MLEQAETGGIVKSTVIIQDQLKIRNKNNHEVAINSWPW